MWKDNQQERLKLERYINNTYSKFLWDMEIIYLVDHSMWFI